MYNSIFPATYQTPYSYQQQSNSLIWVQGEAAAKSYLVAPNSSVALWDSEAQTVYIKSADASGMPSIKVLDYTIRGAATNTPAVRSDAVNDSGKYITKDEMQAVYEQINGIKTRIDKLTRRVKDESALSDDE